MAVPEPLSLRQVRLERRAAEMRERMAAARTGRPIRQPPALGEHLAAPSTEKPPPHLRIVPNKPKKTAGFVWTRADTLALANESCQQCRGMGMVYVGRGFARPDPCKCVLRRIFRACLNQYREIESYIPGGSASLEFSPNAGKRNYGRKREEFAADFCLVARRTIHGADWELFYLHFLLGADWNICCPRLRLSRGNFYHEAYRIEALLGRVMRELQPYALYPLDEYFGSAGFGLIPAA